MTQELSAVPLPRTWQHWAQRLWPPLPAAWRIGHGPGWIAIDKPSQVGAHPVWRSDGDAGDLLMRLAAAGEGDRAAAAGWWLGPAPLGAVTRADREADALSSGVVVATTDIAARAQWEAWLQAGELRATWRAGVSGWPSDTAAARALLAGLAAEGVAVEVLRRQQGRALLELQTPLRIGVDLRRLLRQRGVRVVRLGAEVDEPRRGLRAEADRLLWHRSALLAPGLRLAAPPPAVFDDWLEGRPEPEERRLRRALRRRHGLVHSGATDALRLFDDESTLVLEIYGDALLVAAYDALPEGAPALRDVAAGQELLARQRARALHLADALEVATVWLKLRPRQANLVQDALAVGLAARTPLRIAAAAPAAASAGVGEVVEDDLRYGIDLSDGLQNGIFLDQRDNRRWLRAMAAGRSVLNTFAYTCAFAVAAAAGGARETLSLDASARALDRGRGNLRRNGFTDEERHRTIVGDVFAWLPRLRRRGAMFDLCVLDPPTYAKVGNKRFSAGRDYQELVALAAPLVAAEGWLLACLNHAKVDRQRLEQMLREGCDRAGRRVLQLQVLEPAVDHPGGRMKAARVRLG